tara:strand:+ start:11823 stop:12545 length:723 start_codon:yes stop_codon:yes gene_type:complete
MPKMKPGRDQGNIDKKALAKQTDDPLVLWDENDRIGLNEVTIFAPSGKDKKKDEVNNPNEIGDPIKIDSTISSGGDADPKVKLNTKKEFGDDFLYGTRRFNRLWSLYNEVKDQPGIENNPEYHRLIKKLTRKMPRTIKNLERNVENSLEKRKKIHEQLNPGAPMDLKSDEVIKNVKSRVNEFIKNPFYVKPEPEVEENEGTGNTGKGIVKTNFKPANARKGNYIAPRLGSDIKKSLKNFR